MKQEILSFLPHDHPWRERIQIMDTVSSTNSLLKELGAAGAPEGTAIIAKHQSAGRGRLGRQFHSPDGGGIYMSVILRPGCRGEALMHLTCAVAVAVCDAVEEVTGFRPGIKWINDLVARKRKLAGILTELSFTSEGLVDYAVIGIGLNCQNCVFPEELRPIVCSLEDVLGHPINVHALAAAMLVHLERMNRSLFSGKEEMLNRYRRDCVTLGAEVRVIGAETVRTGKALAMDESGALQVRFSDGHTEWVSSGEVSVRGLWDIGEQKL